MIHGTEREWTQRYKAERYKGRFGPEDTPLQVLSGQGKRDRFQDSE